VAGKQRAVAPRVHPLERIEIVTHRTGRRFDEDRRDPADQIARNQRALADDFERDVAGRVPRRVPDTERQSLEVDRDSVIERFPAFDRCHARRRKHGGVGAEREVQGRTQRRSPGDVVLMLVGQEDRIDGMPERAAPLDHLEQAGLLGRLRRARVDHDESLAAGHPSVGRGRRGHRHRAQGKHPDIGNEFDSRRALLLRVGRAQRVHDSLDRFVDIRLERAEQRQHRRRDGPAFLGPTRQHVTRSLKEESFDLVTGRNQVAQPRIDLGDKEGGMEPHGEHRRRRTRARFEQIVGRHREAGFLREFACRTACAGTGFADAVLFVRHPAGKGPVPRHEPRSARTQP